MPLIITDSLSSEKIIFVDKYLGEMKIKYKIRGRIEDSNIANYIKMKVSESELKFLVHWLNDNEIKHSHKLTYTERSAKEKKDDLEMDPTGFFDRS